MNATYQALKTLREACEAAKDEKGTINGNKLNALRNKAVKEMEAGGETYSDALGMAHDLIWQYQPWRFTEMSSDDKFIIGFGVFVTTAVVGVLWLAFWLANEDAKAWAAFTATHVCERTERTKPGYYITSYVNKTPIMTWVPGQVAWKCDDGKSYWRDE